MIQTLDDLRTAVNNKIKVIPNTATTKTQAADVKQLLTDILDTLNDLVAKQGLSLSTTINSKETAIYNRMDSDVVQVTGVIDTKVSAAKPDLTIYQKVADSIPYSRLINTPTIPVLPDLNPYAKKTDIPTYDFSIYQKVADTIPFSRLTGIPASFSGSYLDLTNKPALFDGSWTSLSNKPTLVTNYNQLVGLPTLFNGDYTSLINKPTIPTYDLSLYRKTADTIDYTTLSNKPTLVTDYSQLTSKPTLSTVATTGSYTDLVSKPTIISDYTQLANKPNMSKLLWNLTSPTSYFNSTTETNVLVAANGNGTLNIEANPVIGTTFRFTGRGLFNTQTVTSPTLSIKLYLGSTQIASGSVSSLLLGATNRPLSFYVDIVIAGTNSIYSQGSMTYFGSVTDILSAAPITNNGLNATVDLSVINQLKMTLTWSIANTANQIQMKIVSLEKLNN